MKALYYERILRKAFFIFIPGCKPFIKLHIFFLLGILPIQKGFLLKNME